jgi:diguanylate cyclase (GGDEF)-like protein
MGISQAPVCRSRIQSITTVTLMLALALALCMRLAGAAGAPSPAPPSGPAQASAEFGFAEPDFESVGDTESIPSGVITSMVQDAHGWLWVGTPNGLVRYDGYRFRTYLHDDADAVSLAGDYVNALWAAPDGRLWVGTNSDGVSIFDPANGRFTHLRDDGASPAKPAAAPAPASGKIWAIVGDANGGVWVGANEGLDYWPRGASRPRRFRHDSSNLGSLADNRVRSLLVDRRGTLWVGTTDGLQRRLAGGTTFERVASDPGDASSLAGDDVRALFEAADGKLWIGTRERGAAWIEPGSPLLHRLALDPAPAGRLSQRFVHAIAQPRPDRIWLGTFDGHGIDIVDARDGRVLERRRHDSSNASSLALDSVNVLLVDRSGLMWVGTWGSGLQRHNPANRAFRMLRHSPADPGGLSHPDVRSVLELADGRILVGSAGNGIDILDRRRGLIGGYRPRPDPPGALGEGAITALAQTADGALWAGTAQAGAFRLAPGARAWEHYASAEGLPHAYVRKLLVGRDGTLWAGTDYGVARWRPELRRFEALAQADGGAMDAVVYALAEGPGGRLWLGTNVGLWVVEPGAASVQRMPSGPTEPRGLRSNRVNGLLFDRSGRLWVATAKGLELMIDWNGGHPSFEHVSAPEGKSDKYLGANLLEDRLGRIWTQWYVYDPASKRLLELTRADGMNIGTSWDRAYAQTHDGLFLYGGTQGVAVVDPEQLQRWAYQPEVRASELAIDGHPAPLGLLAPHLTLGPEQRNFSLSFSAQDYSDPKKSRYAHFLEGYDKEWIVTDAEHRDVNYGNLWHGQYLLRVRATNRVGQWSAHELAIPIVVLPVFWKTGWFMFLVALALAGSIYFAYRWRVARLRVDAERLQELVRTRTAELQEKNRELEQLAVTDRLTGLYNRFKLDSALEIECARSERYGQPFSLLLLDLDKFKQVNDVHGHQAGDQVLVATAGVLTLHTRSVDLVGRWGGEEFLIIASGTPLARGCELAEKLRACIAAHPFPVVGSMSASFGVASFRVGDTPTSLVARADRALYRAKALGRNLVEQEF